MKRKTCQWACQVLAVWVASICCICHSSLAGTTNSPGISEETLDQFENRVAALWGLDNVWLPSSKVLVQYEADLGERSLVDFKTGTVSVQILLSAQENPRSELVLAHMRQGARNLIVGQAENPDEMILVLMEQYKRPVQNIKSSTVAPQHLAALNGIEESRTLAAGRQLKVGGFISHDLTLAPETPPPGHDPLLLDQIRTGDGRSVTHDSVNDFVAEVVDNRSIQTEKVIGSDGVKRQAVTARFTLAPNHLEIRARKFYPLVQAHAEKYQLDPALIMAIIHTESMFNPRARSRTPAYGLMQLVPHSGASEAYARLYGQKKKLNSRYLYDPKNNITLGVTYFDILQNRYMKSIKDPVSRTYCAVAAYNAGASNVGKAFVPKKSMNMAFPVINTMKSNEVYTRLVDRLLFEESRQYIQKVLTRSTIYRAW